MKQFIDKLISRLKEKIFSAELHDCGWEGQTAHNLLTLGDVIDAAEQLAEEYKICEISDGYHTFNELYHHRAVLFATICNSNKELAWKSKLHDTGDMYEGMFIVGIETPQGQATYHYDIEPYWDMFKVKELPKAPKWDGHTPDEAIKRIGVLAEEYKPRTNADRIRNMSDEELAEYISSGEIGAICPECEFYGKEGLCYLDDESGETEKNCSEGILKWLQSEVKEGE